MREIPGPAVLVLMPTRGRITIETAGALASSMDSTAHVVTTVSRLPVVEARNRLVDMARGFLASPPIHAGGGWYCLWVDDDAFWRPGTLTRLLSTIQGSEKIDVLAGWFCGRQAHSNPKATRLDESWPRPGVDCELGDAVEVDRVGFHFVIHRADLLERLPKDPFTPMPFLGEDASFCDQTRRTGARIWVDTGAPVAHVGDDGLAYLPGSGPMRVVGGQLMPVDQQQVRSYGAAVDVAVRASQPSIPIQVGPSASAAMVDSMEQAAMSGLTL